MPTYGLINQGDSLQCDPLRSRHEEITMTDLDASTKFIGAAPVGSTVTAECTAFHRGRTTMVWQTVIKSQAGKVCGVVTQTQIVLPRA